MHPQLVPASFWIEQTFLRTFHRRRLQIYYRHSSAFSYGIKRHTSCAIHMHSGKSYNPVSCERAQVAGLIGRGSCLILCYDVLTGTHGGKKKESKKKKKKHSSEYLRCCHSRPLTRFRAGRTLETCAILVNLFYFLEKKSCFICLFVCFLTWYPRDNDVREDRLLRRLLKC